MSYSTVTVGLVLAIHLFGPGAGSAGGSIATEPRAPWRSKALPIEPAPTMIEAASPLRATPPPLPTTELTCADLDKRRQLRGRIDPAVVAAARSFLNLPMGAGRLLSLDGRRYAFCLEPHYHPPGFSRGPVGWHKGVTVYDTQDVAL